MAIRPGISCSAMEISLRPPFGKAYIGDFVISQVNVNVRDPVIRNACFGDSSTHLNFLQIGTQ
jgi:hypothetical protein